MSTCTIEMFPASYGDCFLVRCHDKEKTNILIDTGFKSTYENFLKERLLALSEAGETLSLLVFTHIDEDHLAGGLKFLEENGDAESPNIIKIDKIWHNSYKHLQLNKQGSLELTREQKEILDSIIRQGAPHEEHLGGFDVETPISAEQGSSLAALILKGRYSWNEDFQEKAVSTETPQEIHLNSEVSLILISPNLEKLEALDEYWRDELYKKGYIDELTDNERFQDAFEFLLLQEPPRIEIDVEKEISYSEDIEELLDESFKFKEDDSETNGSSIAFIIEFDGRKMLFLGDSHPVIIEKQLKELYKDELPVYFDAVKISHHGSKKSTTPDIAKVVDARHYLISTNGRKPRCPHPDKETLFRIVSAGKKYPTKLIFNYQTESSGFINSSDVKDFFKSNYASTYDVVIPNEKKEAIVRIEL